MPATGGQNTPTYCSPVMPGPEHKTNPAVHLARKGLALLCLMLGTCLPAAVSSTETGTFPKNLPRILRYLSEQEGFSDRRCFGMVLEARDGIPVAVCNLGRLNTALCNTGVNAGSSPEQLRLAFATADNLAAGDGTAIPADCRETLPQARLAQVILPPVDIPLQQLVSGERYIIGIGLNYREHREETGAEDHAGVGPAEVLVFPKFVAPTGAYSPVNIGIKIGSPAALPVRLLDYEVELGMLLLEDLDLKALPTGYRDFINQVAFFIANDVSDREPIILDSEAGYTRGKSHPTYLPTGPWMIHGHHLQPLAPGEGSDRLELGVRVTEVPPDGTAGRTRRLQDSATDRMILGPWEIVQTLAARYRQGIRTCMRDSAGEPRYTHTPAGIIPAGSIILTGTPGGTAIREPRPLEKLDLFLRGGLSISGARQQLITDSEHHLEDSRYLQPGDRVETWISGLGRQRWVVEVDAEHRRYGVEGPGDCHIDTDRE
jgi:2-keto-4-pentenoate hydratase/2-oxohepta-3-ene-1,7-dioic acid hydratase in catechol pathway